MSCKLVGIFVYQLIFNCIDIDLVIFLHLQYLQARTPMKPYMLPLSRNETAKTPNRLLPLSHGKNTGTIKKRPMMSQNKTFTSSAKKVVKSSLLRRTELPMANDMSYMQQTMDSDNKTFSILNCSTSTEIDGPSGSRAQQLKAAELQITMPSFSPLMRKIEDAIDKKFTTFMDNFKNQTADFSQLRNHVRQSVNEVAIENFGLIANMDMVSLPQNTSSAQSFITIFHQIHSNIDRDEEPLISSTVQRQPTKVSTLQSDDISSHSENVSGNNNETVLRRRTNRRLTSREFANDANDEVFAVPKLVKRSKSSAPVRPRRSTRFSSYNETEMHKEMMQQSSVEAKPSKKRSKISNQVISLYFNPKNVTKADHKKSILTVLNTGNFKEVKTLPTIGDKTAYQIVSFRSVNGNFKTIADIKKLPAMKGKLWEKFVEVSCASF